MSHQEESQSTPALIHMPESLDLTSSLGMIPENTLLESYTRLSVSLEENGLFQVRMPAFESDCRKKTKKKIQRPSRLIRFFRRRPVARRATAVIIRGTRG